KHQNFRPVYSYIRRHPDCKASEISSGISIPTGSLNRILKQLKDEGLIEYTGSKKTGGYRVKEDAI
ncbi:MAG: MarR family transcriptional regulator, partial [Bacteroidales bacterium]|nr:MarR family transcriptional regulator [Bacteroidales bacterium]